MEPQVIVDVAAEVSKGPLSIYDLGLGFIINLISSLIVVRVIYHLASQRRDFVFTFMLVSTSVFFLCSLLSSVDIGLGFWVQVAKESGKKYMRGKPSVFITDEMLDGSGGFSSEPPSSTDVDDIPF